MNALAQAYTTCCKIAIIPQATKKGSAQTEAQALHDDSNYSLNGQKKSAKLGCIPISIYGIFRLGARKILSVLYCVEISLAKRAATKQYCSLAQKSYTCSLNLSNFNKTASIMLKPRREDPPLDRNGSGMPMTGISPMTIPTLTKRWRKSIPATP